MQTVESAKQLVRVGHVKANAVIPDKIGDPSVPLRRDAEFNTGRDPFGSELVGVIEQVFQYSLQQPGIAVDADAFSNNQFNFALGIILLQCRTNPADRGGQVDGHSSEVCP